MSGTVSLELNNSQLIQFFWKQSRQELKIKFCWLLQGPTSHLTKERPRKIFRALFTNFTLSLPPENTKTGRWSTPSETAKKANWTKVGCGLWMGNSAAKRSDISRCRRPSRKTMQQAERNTKSTNPACQNLCLFTPSMAAITEVTDAACFVRPSWALC